MTPQLDVTDPAPRAARVAFRRGLGLVLGTLLVPGSAQLQAGNRTLGRLAIRIWLGLLITIAVLGLTALLWRPAAVAILASGTFYKILQPLILVLGLGQTWLLVDAWRLAQPLRMDQKRRLGFAGASLAVCLALVASTLGLSAVARAQGHLLDAVLGGGGISRPHEGRYNVLLLGADAEKDREGVRPDSITVASVDERSGRTVLFSLPRNLEGARFPEGSPLHELYPNGYDCPDHSCMLNAVYMLGQEHRDRYPGVKDPGLQAMREAVSETLGLPINYTVMVDLMGFTSIVDAVGGIRLDIHKRVPIGGGTSKVYGYIEPGRDQHLDGYHALWFARSRHGSSDYERMLRQKCVINAMLHQLDPVTVMTKFTELARAGEDVAYTDIPAKDVDKLARLTDRARKKPMMSVSFTPPLLYPGNPKLDVVRRTVQQKIAQSEALDRGRQPASAAPTSKGGAGASAAPRPNSGTPAASATSTPRPTPSERADGSPQPESDDLGQVCSA